MKKITDKTKKDRHICSRCGTVTSDIVASIKTKRGTVLNLCSKCFSEGIKAGDVYGRQYK